MRIERNDPADPLPTRVHIAVHNVRALVEQLQQDEDLRRKWILVGLVGFLPAAVLLAAHMMNTTENPESVAGDRTRPCELAWWAAHSGDFERDMRNANPGMPNWQIQKKLERERPYLMANAKIECNSTARK